jgi:hypothetical protein
MKLHTITVRSDSTGQIIGQFAVTAATPLEAIAMLENYLDGNSKVACQVSARGSNFVSGPSKILGRVIAGRIQSSLQGSI